MTAIAHPELEGLERYKVGWADSDVAGESAHRGSVRGGRPGHPGAEGRAAVDAGPAAEGPEAVLAQADARLGRGPDWHRFRHHQVLRPVDQKQAASRDDLPADIKSTYDRPGIPEAERRRLIGGVAAQYESEAVYHKIREDLQDKGVIFLDADTALKEHPDLLREYFATIIRWATTSPPR